MDLNVLKGIKQRYKNFNEIIKAYRKGKLGTLSADEVRSVKETVEDLFILEIFSCFERFLRNKLYECLKLKDCVFDSEKILNHIEYMKIDDLLDSLKVIVDSHTVGWLKQIKQYRDWIAHGRNPQKPPPVKTVNFDKLFEIIERIMEILEKQ